MIEKNSLFKTPEGEAMCMRAYEDALAHWRVPYEELDPTTRFGSTHVIVSGPKGEKSLILLHGQDSSSTSWIYNITDLSQAFRVYAVDTIGDMGKSKPTCLPNTVRIMHGGYWKFLSS